MKGSFKKFWKDFWALQMESNRFLKEHWKGYLVFTASVTALTYVGLTVWEKIENDKIRKEIDSITKEES